MRRRRDVPSLFGLSFLDVLSCSLGAVAFFLLQTGYRADVQRLFYSNQADAIQSSLTGYAAKLDEANRALGSAIGQRESAITERDAAQRAADEERRGRMSAEMQRKTAEEGRQTAEKAGQESEAARKQAELESDKAKTAAAEAMKQRDDAESARADAQQMALVERNARIKSDGQRDRAIAQLADAQQQLSGVVGLGGDLKHVVFVFDHSGSLGRSDLPAGTTDEEIKRDVQAKLQQFQKYKDLLKAWILALGFEKFNLIEFNDQAKVWKPAAMSDNLPASRTAAAKTADQLEPRGTTNTMEALNQAFALPGIDTIILFSDGQPNDRNNQPVSTAPMTAAERQRAHEAVEWILGEVRRLNTPPDGTKPVVINCVAMGDYLDKDYGRFLRELAREHGGEFIGR